MKFPICKVCLKNDILCNVCAEKIGNLGIKTDELKMFRRLNKLLKRYLPLKDVEIKRAIDNRNIMIIVTNREDASKLIGKNGGMVKRLGKDLNRQIRVIAEPFNVDQFVNEIFFSTPILGINILYTPESKKYLVRIPSSERVLLPMEPEIFSGIADSVLKEEVELVFE